MFYCFGCHTGGNIFTYVMKRDGLDFPEAVQVLADRAGIQLKKGPLRKEADRFKRVVEVNKAAAAWYQGVLKGDPGAAKARQYLRERKLDEQTLERFQIGYAPNQWNQISDFLFARGFDQEWVKESGLIKRNKSGDSYYDLFRDALFFRYLIIREILWALADAPWRMQCPSTSILPRPRFI